jgi:hypothetical protein
VSVNPSRSTTAARRSVTHGTQDLVSSKLPALQAHQLSLKAAAASAGSFESL